GRHSPCSSDHARAPHLPKLSPRARTPPGSGRVPAWRVSGLSSAHASKLRGPFDRDRASMTRLLRANGERSAWVDAPAARRDGRLNRVHVVREEQRSSRAGGLLIVDHDILLRVRRAPSGLVGPHLHQRLVALLCQPLRERRKPVLPELVVEESSNPSVTAPVY